MKRLVVVLGLLVTGCTAEDQSAGQKSERAVVELADSTEQALRTYLVSNYQTPEEYVVSCFEDHDIVFVGEYHRIAHDVELIHALIPRLYEQGIYNLGIEFADYADQDLIDQLIAATEYDDSLAKQIQYNQWPFWGFREYVDIYRVAWELNQSLDQGEPTFRVVGLGARSDWSHVWTVEDRQDPEVMRKVFPEGDTDEYMANIILKEFVDKSLKALIYSGINHGYTRYQQPVYDVEADTLIRKNDHRMGNLVYDAIGDRCMTIFLHSPWPAYNDFNSSVRPVEGVIDALIPTLDSQYQRVGFDVVGSPFAELPGENSYWTLGYPNFTLEDYCDGYIYQMPLGEYEGVNVIDGFINESNRLEAIAQSANPRTKDSSRSVAELMESMRRDTDFGRRFSEFKEVPVLK